MSKLKLNCDLGEKVHDNDALIMPYIDQANITCGLHASDPQTIASTIRLAKKHNVTIGAHPSYPDKDNFGRQSMALSEAELITVLHYQLAAFKQLCLLENAELAYVKPHGALYNDMMKDTKVFTIVCQAMASFSNNLPLMLQALSDLTVHQAIADKFNLPLIFEAFADRNYQDDGLLISRINPNAMITEHQIVIDNIQQLLTNGKVKAASGKLINLTVDSLCVHGDNPQAIELVKQLRQLIDMKSH